MSAGDSVQARDPRTGRLMTDFIVRNHRCPAQSAVRLRLSNGDTLIVSARQPLIGSNGEILHAGTIERRWGGVEARAAAEPLRLRTLSGQRVEVRSAQVVHPRRALRWLETMARSNIFAGDVETSTDPLLKIDEPVSPFTRTGAGAKIDAREHGRTQRRR